VNLSAELEASLKEFLSAGLVDLHENGGRTSFAGGLSWEVRGDGEKPLLHLWAERFNVTRRVLAITDHSEPRLVLAVERFGRTKPDRLAIIELKASEHIHLPLQAADYWLRVRKHLERGEISRYGYFPGLELQQTSPFVYLVAPALRFHPSTDEILKFLSPELEVVRVGLAESWKRGLRVVMRQ